MIIDPSGTVDGVSTLRLSKYLSLCKIDYLVRKVDNSTSHCLSDQPGKAAKAVYDTESSPSIRSDLILEVSFAPSKRIRPPSFLKAVCSQRGFSVESFTKVGSITLRQGNMDMDLLPLYAVGPNASSFAYQHKPWSFCLILKDQQSWVDGFLNTLRSTRLLDRYYLIGIGKGQIGYFLVPKLKGAD